MLHTHRDLCWLPPQRFKCMLRCLEKGTKVGSWSQFLRTLPRKTRFHKGAGSRINGELPLWCHRLPSCSCCGDGGWATGDRESGIHGPLQVPATVVGVTYMVLTGLPGACRPGQHLCVWWAVTRPELEARYLTWFRRPTQKPTWNQIFLKSTGLMYTQCSNELWSTQRRTVTD